MGKRDGSVLGVTKIVDNGRDAFRFTILLMPDGYTAAEMSTWHADAQSFVDTLLVTAPFSDYDLTCAVNVHRFDVVSDESGADDPQCTIGGGAGVKVKTYFDATFCSDGDNRRTMEVDSGTVWDTVHDYDLLAFNAVVVIVNSPIVGGTTISTSIAIVSTTPGWEQSAIHELGHAAFGLADEYDYYSGCTSGETGHNQYGGPEPYEPNVTATLSPLKWGALVDAGTKIPTTRNKNCKKCDPQSSPVPAGTVGAFAGAYYFHCGAYRPEFTCHMRNAQLGVPFCAVCQQVIRDGLSYLAPPTTITMLTPTLTFTDVEEGTTTARAVAFEVDTCRTVYFNITEGPERADGGPADFHGEPVLDAPLGERIASVGPGRRTAYVWISYQATNPGDTLTGIVTLENELTHEKYGVIITGNTVARTTVGVMLALDESNSMHEPAAGGGTKGEALQDAAGVFVDVMPDDDGLGVVTFATDASVEAAVTTAGHGAFGAGRVGARAAIDDYEPDPDGMTSIGDAIAKSDAALPENRYDALAMVIFTDGVENSPQYISDVASLISTDPRIFAIGLGTPENLSPATLATLCSGNDGVLLLTEGDSDMFFIVTKFYLQILAGLTSAEIVYDPVGYLPPTGTEIRIPFVLTETDTAFDAVLVTPVPGAVVYSLETPAGDVIGPTTSVPGGEYVQGSANAYYRLALPTVVGGHDARVGTWYAVVSLNLKVWQSVPLLPALSAYLSQHPSAVANGLPYSLQVQARSNLKLVATCDQDSYAPGAELRVRGILTEYDIPVDGRATVAADLTRPDGTLATLSMPEIEPGVFETVETASQSGTYQFRVVAVGDTLRDNPFTREQLVTAFAYHGGDDPAGHHDCGQCGCHCQSPCHCHHQEPTTSIPVDI